MTSTTFKTAIGALFGTAVLFTSQSHATSPPLFSEDFENGLGQWTGRADGANHGVIVSDPLNSGRGNVLAFTALNSGGDMFSTSFFTVSGTVTMSFDYLGLPQPGHTSNLGGFIGYSYSHAPIQQLYDNFWPAGTDPNAYPLSVQLIDDGTWHHYSFNFDSSAAHPFCVMIEQYSGDNGLPGQALFDNISVNIIPEPSAAAFAVLAAGVLLFRTRCGRRRSRTGLEPKKIWQGRFPVS